MTKGRATQHGGVPGPPPSLQRQPEPESPSPLAALGDPAGASFPPQFEVSRSPSSYPHLPPCPRFVPPVRLSALLASAARCAERGNEGPDDGRQP